MELFDLITHNIVGFTPRAGVNPNLISTKKIDALSNFEDILKQVKTLSDEELISECKKRGLIK